MPLPLTISCLFQASADRCIVQKSGFLDGQSDNCSMRGKEFNSICKFRFCCRDVRVGEFIGLVVSSWPLQPLSVVKDRASELVGQRLFHNKPDNEGWRCSST